jgi:hypothetical protein
MVSVSLVRTVKTSVAWISFLVGGISNALLLWLIGKHTPKPMRVYGKVFFPFIFVINFERLFILIWLYYLDSPSNEYH